MKVVLNVVGLLTILVALLQTVAALSAMHETTAAVTWVGGWLLLAAGALLDRVERMLESTQKGLVDRG